MEPALCLRLHYFLRLRCFRFHAINLRVAAFCLAVRRFAISSHPGSWVLNYVDFNQMPGYLFVAAATRAKSETTARPIFAMLSGSAAAGSSYWRKLAESIVSSRL